LTSSVFLCGEFLGCSNPFHPKAVSPTSARMLPRLV
jgi:hypothetical protein